MPCCSGFAVPKQVVPREALQQGGVDKPAAGPNGCGVGCSLRGVARCGNRCRRQRLRGGKAGCSPRGVASVSLSLL